MQGEYGLKDKEPIKARSLSDKNKTERVHVLCISDLTRQAHCPTLLQISMGERRVLLCHRNTPSTLLLSNEPVLRTLPEKVLKEEQKG